MRIGDRLARIKAWYDKINEMVWLRAANRLLVVVLGIAFLAVNGVLKFLKIEIDFARLDPTIVAFSVVAVLCVYLYTVAIMTADILEVERRLRSSEQRFHFNRGTLFYGTEPGIYSRVPTFKRLLAAIGYRIGPERAKEVFLDLGREAAENFCLCLPAIYDENYQKLVGGQKWELLPQKKKIERWLEYDSQAGWGNFAGRMGDRSIVIHIQHFEDLFAGEDGTFVAYFMAGYCLTVLNSIVSSGDGDFREAILESGPFIDDAVKITYRLR